MEVRQWRSGSFTDDKESSTIGNDRVNEVYVDVQLLDAHETARVSQVTLHIQRPVCVWQMKNSATPQQ